MSKKFSPLILQLSTYKHFETKILEKTPIDNVAIYSVNNVPLHDSLLSQPSSQQSSVSLENGLDALQNLPDMASSQLKSLNSQLVDMLLDDLKIGISIFTIKEKNQENMMVRSSQNFKFSLLWNNPVFQQQFDLKNEMIDDQLN